MHIRSKYLKDVFYCFTDYNTPGSNIISSIFIIAYVYNMLFTKCFVIDKR